MANPYRGEVAFSFNGRAFTLRPTFHIIATLEHRRGLTLPELLKRVQEKGLLASEILLVLAVGTRHDGSAPFPAEQAMALPADDPSLHHALPAVARFLLNAMGRQRSFDIALLMQQAFDRLGLYPAQFWRLTMTELQYLSSRKEGQPLGAELAVLKAQFPDKHPMN